MREITINQDGTLNIIDTRKIYCLVINWDKVNDEHYLSGIKYYFPVRHSHYWTFDRDGGYFGDQIGEKDLQYVVEYCLTFLSIRHKYDNAAKMIEFKDQQEFNQYLEQ
jgi:hypothetical protein